jgi:hypothetical protein
MGSPNKDFVLTQHERDVAAVQVTKYCLLPSTQAEIKLGPLEKLKMVLEGHWRGIPRNDPPTQQCVAEEVERSLQPKRHLADLGYEERYAILEQACQREVVARAKGQVRDFHPDRPEQPKLPTPRVDGPQFCRSYLKR